MKALAHEIKQYLFLSLDLSFQVRKCSHADRCRYIPFVVQGRNNKDQNIPYSGTRTPRNILIQCSVMNQFPTLV